MTTYDHGLNGRPAEFLLPIADDGVLGSITPYGRRVWGVAVHEGENRLYYGVWWEDTVVANPIENNEVWSVGLDAAGDPIPATANLEITLPLLPALPYSNPAAGLNFTVTGSLLVGERTYQSAHESRLLEYVGGTGNWIPHPTNKYRIGANNLCCSGAGAMDCLRQVWSAGDAMAPFNTFPLYGLTRIPAGGNATHSPQPQFSLLLDSDQNTTASDKWGIGTLAFLMDCGELCYANCDQSTVTPVLTPNDFQCFLNRYAAADPYANCDESTTTPVLTANDFLCFLNTYAAGCP